MSETSDNSNDSSIIPVTSAYYLGSSDNPSSILVSNVFNGVGFTAWKRSMIIALSAKNKLGFVDGSITRPEITSSDYSKWNRVNSMVISWLLNSLHKNIADSVLFLQTASAIWTEFNQRYEQTNGALIYQIQQNLYSISQGSDDFQTYYTKLMNIWDELRVVQDFPECSCGTAAKIYKFLEDQRLIQLLMGLNDSYKIIRGQILMMKPLPSLSTAYALIIQEEQRREINASSIINHDAIAMNATSDQHNSLAKKHLTCNHCKKPGHTKAQCYRLIGFPANFKFTKGKKDDHQSTVQNATATVIPDTSSPHITSEQYQQLLQMLNNHQLNSSGSSSRVNASVYSGAMNSEGPLVEE